MTEKEFEKFFKTNYKAVVIFCNKYLKDVDVAKDIANNSFIKFWNKKDELDISNNPKVLVYTIAKNLCLNYIRDNKKISREEDIVENSSSENDTSKEIELSELKSEILSEIKKLPEKSKKAFLMSRFNDLSYSDIAQRLDVSIKSVEYYISSALKILRKKFLIFLGLLALYVFL